MATYSKHPDIIDIPGAVGAWWCDLRSATAFLTCLPVAPRRRCIAPDPSAVPAEDGSEGDVFDNGRDRPADDLPAELPNDLPRSTAMFPLVGCGIGLVAASALMAAFEIGFNPLACALVALAVSIVISAALHEDGLADFADALSGSTRERRLSIMRDSRIGTFGTLAIVLGVGLRAAILSGLSSSETAMLALIGAATLSRAVLPAVMRWQVPARSDGLSAGFATPSLQHIVIATVLALVICFVTIDFWPTLIAAAAVILAALAVALLAQRLLGGHTGDVLGTVQVISEIAALAVVAALE
ncbi:MAG: adenosylcobinamide-GDP ribazoletransferase [Rhodospirillales bacterium]|nr:adenosylcobinamide-GDP ribazoletransferase [Rhodospirillales bacterium]